MSEKPHIAGFSDHIRPGCVTLKIITPAHTEDSAMLSTLAQNVGTLGHDILSLGSAALQFAQDLITSGGTGGGGGGTYPPGQYPLN
ncbi:hypothetical protein GCM10027167_89920 [Nocardia heshunensis]